MVVEEYKFKKKRSIDIENELHRITQEWCRLKHMSELTFAFGHVDFDKFPDAKIFLCKLQNNIIAYLIYFPIYGLNSYYLDLSRREINAPRGAIDFLFVKSFEILKTEGIKKVYIGYSPTKYKKNDYLSSRVFTTFKPLLEFFYPAKTEFFFKNKYATKWEPNYFFYYPRISIRMLFALVHSVYNGGLASICIHKFKDKFKVNF
jgi:phosphatidylglycerol lysyltransferase